MDDGRADDVRRPQLARSRSESDIFSTQSREGYFGDDSANIDSNAGDLPRIVLSPSFGEQRKKREEKRTPLGGSLRSLGLTDEVVAKQLEGCAGRYVGALLGTLLTMQPALAVTDAALPPCAGTSTSASSSRAARAASAKGASASSSRREPTW